MDPSMVCPWAQGWSQSAHPPGGWTRQSRQTHGQADGWVVLSFSLNPHGILESRGGVCTGYGVPVTTHPPALRCLGALVSSRWC